MSKEKEKDREEATAAFNDMLASSLRSFTAEEVEAMRKAFALAYEAHKGTRRKSGEAYIMHPIAVAKIVAHEIGLGYKSITAALLHDVVEDTEYTNEDIQGMFGEKISFLVDGLTKLDNIFDNNVSIQAENFKKMMLAMADDIRVVLIKLADRLHNMRTLGSMAPHKQEKIASETIYLYAPLAHRLGLYNIKTEMEDLTMKFQFPKMFDELHNKIASTAAERNAYIEQFVAPIKEHLNEKGFSFEINGRVKSIYSIWKKMETKQIPFEEIYDLFAVRIVFKPSPDSDEKQQCWQIYSMVTDIYRPNYNRLRDWLTTPKDNGYEALHITVMGPEGKWVELQIRTERMDEIAERGYAAHWRYKENKEQETGKDVVDTDLDVALDSWLGRIREMLTNNEENAIEFLDQFKLNTFADNITVYTPKGKMVKLPKKSTAIDFAYEIHTAIGNKSIGAKVNHKLVPLNYVLSSGDQVEMLTADNQKPQADWLNFATTSRARNQIKVAMKAEVKEHFQKGKQAVEDAVRQAGAQPNAKLYKRITDAYKVANKQELFSQIGAGILKPEEIERVVRKQQRRNKLLRYMELQLLGTGRRKHSDEPSEKTPSETIDKKAFLLKEGTDPSKLAYRIAACCNPIPGDSVVGFLEANNKVLIHKKSCPIAIREASQHGDKIVNAKWTEHKMLSFLARIKANGIDRIGMTQEILKVVSEEMRVNIRRINAESHDGLFENELDIYVHSTTELNSIISKLQKISGVEEVNRVG